MRKLVRLLAVLGIIVGLLGLVVALSAASQLNTAAEAGRPEPRTVRLADLVKDGPGDNLHVELTRFSFGKPVIEEKDARWNAVWLPLFIPGRRAKGDTPPAFLHTGLVHDQSELDALLAQKSVDALVASAMPESRWKMTPAAALYADYPKLDPAQAIVLSDPAMVSDGKVLVTRERLFTPSPTRSACAMAASMAGLAIFGMLLRWMTGPRRRRQRVDLTDASRLTDQSPESTHEFSAAGASKRGRTFMGLVVGMFLITMLTASSASKSYRKGNGTAAVTAVAVGGTMLLGTAALAFAIFGDVLFPVSQVALYRSGIRWQRGRRQYTARWCDIESVYRMKTEVFVNGEHRRTAKVLTLDLNDGSRLRLYGDTLSDYDNFADRVQSLHGGYMLDAKQREQAECGEATFGDIGVRAGGVTLGGTFVPWSGLERFDIENGHLNLYAPQLSWSKRRSYPLRNIPNYAVLLELLRSRAMCY